MTYLPHFITLLKTEQVWLEHSKQTDKLHKKGTVYACFDSAIMDFFAGFSLTFELELSVSTTTGRLKLHLLEKH